MADDLVLESLDYNWNRLAVTPHVVRASVTEELGAVGEAEVTIPADDGVIDFIPDPDSAQSNEGRWRLWEGSDIAFAGVVDQTTRTLNADNTYSFGGKHRGILLGTANVGRRDFNGWPIDELFQELLWDNIGKAPIASVAAGTSDSHALHPAVNAIIGDLIENNYWASAVSGTNHTLVIDLGAQEDLVAVRVVPPWWDKRWYQFTAHTSTDNSSWTLRGTYNTPYALSDKGKLFTFNTTARYVKITMTSTEDQIGRLAAVFVYRELASVGADTDFVIPWIENDDSGNVTTIGTTVQVSENGAFNGDGILGHSLVTRLSGSGEIHHRFRGTTTSVYFTQGTGGGAAACNVYLDNVVQQTSTIAANTYEYKGFEIVGLSNGEHHLKVVQTSGTRQVDYFTGLYKTSYRPIRDDDTSLAFGGVWVEKSGENFSNYHSMHSATFPAHVVYPFTGDKIKVFGSKGTTYGLVEYYIDDALQSTVDCYNATEIFQQTLFTWSGSYADHTFRLKGLGTRNAPSTANTVHFDGLEGNFDHNVYLRSFYETNLRLLTRLSEITNTFLRFNNDGTVDLLGQVGDWAGTVIREGENEGGTIISANAENDYSETASAVLALVTDPSGLPIKAFVIDRNAVAKMGLKIRKAENADANDAYLLTRQAWTELQEHIDPEKRYTVEYDPSEVGDIQVGQTTVLHSQRLGLTGNDQFRIGRLVTEWDN